MACAQSFPFFYFVLMLSRLSSNSFVAERYLEIGVLQDNADLLKSKNVSLNDEAQALNLQMTVS